MGNIKRAPEIIRKGTGETKLVHFDFADDLEGTRVLSGTPVIVEEGTSDLTLTNKSASGTKAQALVAGGTADTTYVLQATVTDNGTPQQTFQGEGRLRVEAP